MSENRYAIVCALSVVCCCPKPAVAADPAPAAGHDIVSQVRAVFSARCIRCHGPDLARPRGGFGYILDLKRLATNPLLIVPTHPDESELWLQVRSGEMPPPDSPTGPLTASEKEVIRTWIASGAPAESVPAPTGPSSERDEETQADGPAKSSLVRRGIRWLGKFHLLMLHFPIALVLAAGAAELWSVRKRSSVPSPAARFCLWLGAAAAIPTVVLGWLYALSGHGAGSPALLSLHRWLGTAAGMWMVGAALASERDAHRGRRSRYVRIMILAGAMFVVIAAHFGGILAHGETFFDW